MGGGEGGGVVSKNSDDASVREWKRIMFSFINRVGQDNLATVKRCRMLMFRALALQRIR